MNSKYEAVVFDLDGTLVDSLPDIAWSVNEMLRRHGREARSVEAIRLMIGNGSRKLVERALGVGSNVGVDEALALYKDIYAENLLARTRPYAGVLETLAELRRRGIKLAVCSNKHASAVRQVAAALFPPGTFDVVLGNSAAMPPKPDPKMIQESLSAMQVKANATLYLGDSGVDMETSRRAGTTGVGVTWGYRDAAELLECGAKRLISDMRELTAC